MIAAIADVHLANHRRFGGATVAGLNDRARAILRALTEASTVAVENGAGALVVLGDLFDSAAPTPQLVAAAMAVLAPPRVPYPIHIMLGNHDLVSDDLGDHALGPFAHVPGVTVHTKPAIVHPTPGMELAIVPYQSGEARVWLPEVLDGLLGGQAPGTRRRVLALHLGIHDHCIRERHAWAEAAHDAVSTSLLIELCQEHDISQVIAGNWHRRESWEVVAVPNSGAIDILQVGALVPTGWDNAGLEGYGTVALIDGRSRRHVEVRGPRFVDVTCAAELDALPVRSTRHDLYVRWVAPPEDMVGVGEVLRQAVERHRIKGYTVQVEQSAVKAQAREAAVQVRSATTLTDALARYVRDAPFDPAVDRDEVLDRSREYLGT